MFQRILVPTDGTDITKKAVETAVSLARSLGSKLYALSVKEPFPYSAISEMQPTPPQEFYDAQERIAAARVQAVRDACTAAGLGCEAMTVEALHPWEAIIDYAKQQDCDLIVMASHGRRGVSALLLGSETQRVLIHTTVPVLIVRCSPPPGQCRRTTRTTSKIIAIPAPSQASCAAVSRIDMRCCSCGMRSATAT
jgi:nucleotide-binding universal stress UspA family protein